jgi:cytoskeletal protein RodZ
MANLGSRFRARREEQGRTLDDIAATTKIPRRLLVDLEGNDFTHWPASRVYCIGYLRAYAAAVGLDAAQAIVEFDADGLSHRTAVTGPRDGSRPKVRRRLPRFSFTLALAACLLGAFVVARPLYVKSASPVAPQTPMVSRPPADIALEALPADATAVPTSGGTLESDDAEGELLIESTPAGTHVVVNGIARGATPIRLQYLPIGPYTIRLVRDGYESQEVSATLTNERPVRSLSIALRERAP